MFEVFSIIGKIISTILGIKTFCLSGTLHMIACGSAVITAIAGLSFSFTALLFSLLILIALIIISSIFSISIPFFIMFGISLGIGIIIAFLKGTGKWFIILSIITIALFILCGIIKI